MSSSLAVPRIAFDEQMATAWPNVISSVSGMLCSRRLNRSNLMLLQTEPRTGDLADPKVVICNRALRAEH